MDAPAGGEMNHVTEFLDMGGYAAYVWSAYGVTLGVMLCLIWRFHCRHSSLLAAVRGRRRYGGSPEQPRQPKVRLLD
jgi:heme exporter protein CcmD